MRAGHELHLLCQDRDPFEHDWVDAAGDWDGGALSVGRARSRSARPSTARHRRPAAGLRRRPLRGHRGPAVPRADRCGVEHYLERNVAAVREVAARARPEVALANHLVMGPACWPAALAGDVPYAVKVHGSALEYTVKPYPRFRPTPREGLAGARGVLVGSRHTAESLWAAMDDPGAAGRTRLGPPGVDVEQFAPREPAAARARGPARALPSTLARPPRGGRRAPARPSRATRGEAAAALATASPTTASSCSSAS